MSYICDIDRYEKQIANENANGRTKTSLFPSHTCVCARARVCAAHHVRESALLGSSIRFIPRFRLDIVKRALEESRKVICSARDDSRAEYQRIPQIGAICERHVHGIRALARRASSSSLRSANVRAGRFTLLRLVKHPRKAEFQRRGTFGSARSIENDDDGSRFKVTARSQAGRWDRTKIALRLHEIPRRNARARSSRAKRQDGHATRLSATMTRR